jgi:uncharacterized membrane protein
MWGHPSNGDRMSKNMSRIMSIGLIMIAFIATLFVYQRLPEVIAIHWNAAGQADGSASKAFMVFLLPILQVATYLLLLGIPMLDPKRENIERFKDTYELFLTVFMGFMTYIQILLLTYNLGGKLDMTLWIVPGMSALMYFCGHLMTHTHQNYFIGIRTPWTLHNTQVWDDTHRLGGIGFKVVALIIFCGILFPPVAFLFMIIPLLILPMILIVYSYIRYKELTA